MRNRFSSTHDQKSRSKKALPSKDNEFDYNLLFDKEVNSWIMNIIKIDHEHFEKLKKCLEILNFKLQLNHKGQYLEISLPELIGYPEYLQNQKIKCRFQIQFDANIALTFFTYFLEREITNRSLNYEFRNTILNEIYNDFTNFYELEKNFKLPTKEQLKDFVYK